MQAAVSQAEQRQHGLVDSWLLLHAFLGQGLPQDQVSSLGILLVCELQAYSQSTYSIYVIYTQVRL